MSDFEEYNMGAYVASLRAEIARLRKSVATLQVDTQTRIDLHFASLVEAARRFCSMAPPWGHADRHVRLEALREALVPFGGWIQRAAAEPSPSCYCDAPEFQTRCPVHGKAEPKAEACVEATYCKTCFGTGEVEQDIPLGEVDVYPCPTCRP